MTSSGLNLAPNTVIKRARATCANLPPDDCIGLLGNGPVWWRFIEQGRAFSVASGERLEFNHIAPAIDACVARAWGRFVLPDCRAPGRRPAAPGADRV